MRTKAGNTAFERHSGEGPLCKQ